MVGWVYRRSSFSDTSDLYWGGHLVAHKMLFNEDGTVSLTYPDGIGGYFGYEEETEHGELTVSSGNRMFAEAYESFMLKGSFRFEGGEKFGLVLGYGNDPSAYRYVEYDPERAFLVTGSRAGARTSARSPYRSKRIPIIRLRICRKGRLPLCISTVFPAARSPSARTAPTIR